MKEWFRKAIIYHIFIDRFAGFKKDCDPAQADFCGGNIEGIRKKLDYIKSLGADTIWLSPFYKTSAYHGYHITNFNQVDPRFGSIEDLKGLIKECKKKQVKIIADIVPNHCSKQHPWFKNAQKNSSGKYKDWFYFKSWPKEYLKFMGFAELPKLNLENTETAEWMIKSLVNWAGLGFDGFRIDHVLGIPDSFLSKLNRELKKINPDFILIGEAWGEGMKHKYLENLRLKGKHKLWEEGFNQLNIQKHYEGILDGVLDFGWRNLLIEYLHLKTEEQKDFRIKFKTYNTQFNKDFFLLRFLDNHDTSRIMHICNNDIQKFERALKILYKQKQPIVIYYGTEAGMEQSESVSIDTPYSDLNARGIMNWKLKEQSFQYLISKLAHEKI